MFQYSEVSRVGLLTELKGMLSLAELFVELQGKKNGCIDHL